MLIQLRGRAPIRTIIRRAVCLQLFATICCVPVLPTAAQEGVAVRVEEDWKLVLESPDPNSTAPQITAVFSPHNHLGGLHAAFELNHRSQPSFAPGGLQLQVWNGELPIGFRSFPQTNTMSLNSEQVSWTQVMSIQDGVLTIEIANGESDSWGAFGGQGHLEFSVSTNLGNLNSYDPELTVQHSGVGYAANRVQSLSLQRVRVVFADGQVAEDDQVRVVWQHN